MAELIYEVSFKGVASPALRAAFPDCEIGTGSGCTPIRCTRAALPTVISRMEDLGLQLLDIRLRAGHFDEPGRRTSAERGSDQESPEAG